MEINFKYQERNYIVKYNEADLIKDVCKKFAEDNNLDFDYIYFVYEEEKIDFNLELFVRQLYDLKIIQKIKNKKEWTYLYMKNNFISSSFMVEQIIF